MALPPLSGPLPFTVLGARRDPAAVALERARRFRAPLLLALWALLAFEGLGGLVIFFTRVAFGALPGEALHVLGGVALTLVYAAYQWRHWTRVRPFRPRMHFALGLVAALSMALTNLSGLALGWLWWRYRLDGTGRVPYPPLLSALHDIGSMMALSFILAHLGAVLARNRRARAGPALHGGLSAMSELPTLIDERHVRYIAEHTLPEDPFLKDLKREAAAAGIPPIWIAPAQASFIQILLKLGKAREVVEVGTLAGYSAIAMARALPGDGRVRTIELEAKHADFAERWIARSDVAGRIDVLRGSGLDVLPRLAAESADAAFLDADKGNYPKYLAECLRIVRRGGLIMADNAFAFGELFDEKPGDREVPAIRHFNDIMAREPRLESIIVPFGDGLWVGVKR